MKIIRKVDKKELQEFIYNIDLDDSHIYDEIRKDDTIGIFQFNGALASGITRQVKPANFNEMVAINSLARPGTSSFTEDYISGKDKGQVKYPPVVNELLKETYGLCIFQESMMSIFNVVGGFSLEETNDIRGLMKKLGKAEKSDSDLKKWDKAVKKFTKGAIKNGLSEDEANRIAEDLLGMSEYSFNKCFSGDSVIDRDNKARWSPTIEEMYKTKNDKKWAKENGHISLYRKYNRQGYGYAKSLNEDNKLYANKIINIYFEGERDVFRITLENGKYIDVTSNHNFPVSNKNNNLTYKSINNGLKIGNLLFCNEGYDKSSNYKYNFSDFSKTDRIFKSYEGEGFKEDRENSAYINGEFLKFKRNKQKILDEVNNICQYCGDKTNRIEIHHIDLNRLNNKKENLVGLCPGCHKKEHYKEGRKKKNTKGSLTRLYKIIDINYIGKKNTYNVEMETPYHTLSVNGIVAKNSHATAYSYIAVMTLYLSYYFKRYFLSAVLQDQIDDGKDIIDKIQSIRSQGMEVLPPDINKSQVLVSSLDNKRLLLGLKNIKKISDTSAPHIVNRRPYYGVFDFITKTEGRMVRIDVIKALISVGAFDFENPERKRLLLAVDMFWKNKKSIKVKEKLKIIWDKCYKEAMNIKGFNIHNSDLKDFENEYLGGNFFTSSFPKEMLMAFSKLRDRKLIYYSFDEVTAIPRKIPIYIQNIRHHTDKNGNEMAFITGEDVLGKTEKFPIFASYWKNIKDMFEEDTACFVQMFLTDDGVMFGSPKWVDRKAEMLRMVKPIKIEEK